MVLADAAQNAATPYAVYAALVTGSCTVIGALIALRGGKKKEAPTPQQHYESHYHFVNGPNYVPQAQQALERRRGSRRVPAIVLVIALAVTATAVIYILGNVSRSTGAGTGPTYATETNQFHPLTVLPPPTSAGGTRTDRPLTLLESVQTFMDRYRSAYKARPTAETLDAYWSFPIRWYSAPEPIPDADTLLHTYLGDGRPASKSKTERCPYGAPRVVAAEQKSGHLEIRVSRTWTLSGTDKSGAFITYYDMRPSSSGEPYRMFRVYEDANLKVCQ